MSSKINFDKFNTLLQAKPLTACIILNKKI